MVYKNVFIKKIVDLSESKTWEEAKLEWKLDHIYEEKGNCLCGHSIFENCVIINTVNNHKTIAGNCCVKKLMDNIESNKLFQSYKKVKTDISKGLCFDIIVFLFRKKILNDWEFKFYANTHSKRKLSKKQTDSRIKINKKALKYIDRNIE